MVLTAKSRLFSTCLSLDLYYWLSSFCVVSLLSFILFVLLNIFVPTALNFHLPIFTIQSPLSWVINFIKDSTDTELFIFNYNILYVEQYFLLFCIEFFVVSCRR